MPTLKIATSRKPIQLSLPNGSFVDIATVEGANAFLEGVPVFNLFSCKLKELRELRKKQGGKKRLDFREAQKFDDLRSSIEAIIKFADPETFRAKVSESEVEDLLDFLIEEIKILTENRRFINSGRLEASGMNSLDLCGFCFGQYSVCHLALKNDFFRVLANFIRARQGNGRALPNAHVCGYIGLIVQHAITFGNPNNTTSRLEKMIKQLEASGMLEQVLRCATVLEGSLINSQESYKHVLMSLASCVGFMIQKFKSGNPCGDTLKAILAGQDGSRNIPPETLHWLRVIASLVEFMDPTPYKAVRNCMCNFCGNTEAELLCCAKCRLASYCSRQCQRAHWKKHKPGCQHHITPLGKRQIPLNAAALKFMFMNKEIVLEELQRVCRSTGLKESDLLVELDFNPREDGIVPAMCVPPMFDISLFQACSAGQELPEGLHGSIFPDLQHIFDHEMLLKFLEERSKHESTWAAIFIKYSTVRCVADEIMELLHQGVPEGIMEVLHPRDAE